MIDDKTQSLIFERAYGYDHNFNFYQQALGEPFFEEDIIIYYDYNNKTLFIPFFPLNNNFNYIEKRINNIVQNHSPEIIIYWGYINLAHIKILGYNLLVDRYFDEYDVDATIKISDFSLERNKIIKKTIENIEETIIKIEIKGIKKLKKEHLIIIKDFFDNHKSVDSFDTHLINSLRKILHLPTIKIVEARKDSTLVGFAILDMTLPNLPIDLFGFYNKNLKGISSILYLKIIEYCKKSGADYLNLGNTINKGLFDYKKKWGCIFSKPIDSNVWESKKGAYKNLLKIWDGEKTEMLKELK